MNTQYKPMNCEVHDGYELACMRQTTHTVIWHDERDELHQEPLRFLDLETKKGEEFLIAENRRGERVRIRLDMISSELPF